jgi:hypothetical protein
MKTLEQFVNEHKGQPIDDQWINDENPVMTRDGRKVEILSVNMKEVPNVIIGQIKDGDKVLNFKWEDDGTCISAEDKIGNPVRPSREDDLVKAI